MTIPTTKAPVDLRRAAIIAAGLGVASFVLLIPMGYALAALFFCAGLGLGMLNTALVQRSAARFAAVAKPSNRRFAMGVVGRLAVISVLALGLAVLVQPEGLAVFAGLAAFQLLVIILAAIPLFRELRGSTSADAGQDTAGQDTAGQDRATTNQSGAQL